MAADEIKIEWAKDYFGPDAEMAVQNDNVAQLCYYYKYIKESIATARQRKIGNIQLSDDAYVVLYKADIGNALYGDSDLEIICMQRAADTMQRQGYYNAYQYGTFLNINKTWPKNFGYPKYKFNFNANEPEDWHRYKISNGRLPIIRDEFELFKSLLYLFNSYKGKENIYDLIDFKNEKERFSNFDFVMKTKPEYLWHNTAQDEQERWERTVYNQKDDLSDPQYRECLKWHLGSLLTTIIFGLCALLSIVVEGEIGAAIFYCFMFLASYVVFRATDDFDRIPENKRVERLKKYNPRVRKEE